MSAVGRFLLFHLLPALFVGALAWGTVKVALRYLPITDPRARLSFYGAPVVKSAFVLLGLGAVLPWPRSLWGIIQENTLPLAQLLPPLIIWFGLFLLFSMVLTRSLRKRLLQKAYAPDSDRLEKLLQQVCATYNNQPTTGCDTVFYRCSEEESPVPQLLLSEEIDSPMAMTEGGQQVILMPASLPEILSDAELTGVLAHELGHFVLRRSRLCSPNLLRRLLPISPGAALVLARLNLEEEVACDRLAVQIVKEPELYAETLLKSYHFARSNQGREPVWLRLLPRLTGRLFQLSGRIERVLNQPLEQRSARGQYLLVCFLWMVLSLLYFSQF